LLSIKFFFSLKNIKIAFKIEGEEQTFWKYIFSFPVKIQAVFHDFYIVLGIFQLSNLREEIILLDK
jgi:hypothetical protein